MKELRLARISNLRLAAKVMPNSEKTGYKALVIAEASVESTAMGS